jgi:hypothetical protein
MHLQIYFQIRSTKQLHLEKTVRYLRLLTNNALSDEIFNDFAKQKSELKSDNENQR